MFTKEEYVEYFRELEDIIKKTLTIYTDMLNSLEDQIVRSSLEVLATENMDAYRFMKQEKERL
ncbi:MAG: hypothetical protein HQ575_00200 [Candidatus Omnitrophica bacterium]|nr:hypothetical protein [Candidatus Omnitrophota bacterium]